MPSNIVPEDVWERSKEITEELFKHKDKAVVRVMIARAIMAEQEKKKIKNKS
jgi:hypothetical protein